MCYHQEQHNLEEREKGQGNIEEYNMTNFNTGNASTDIVVIQTTDNDKYEHEYSGSTNIINIVTIITTIDSYHSNEEVKVEGIINHIQTVIVITVLIIRMNGFKQPPP